MVPKDNNLLYGQTLTYLIAKTFLDQNKNWTITEILDKVCPSLTGNERIKLKKRIKSILTQLENSGFIDKKKQVTPFKTFYYEYCRKSQRNGTENNGRNG